MLGVEVAYVLFLMFMLLQGALSIYLTLYAWEAPDRLEYTRSPRRFIAPKRTFSILLPARHEQAVIGETIIRLAHARYPKHMLEILLVCDSDDYETIAAAKAAIKAHHISNAFVVTYSDLPISKPHGLNVALKHAKHDVTVIFDAEDTVHPDIFNVANTLYESSKADIIQAGTQLMDYGTHWFSAHNVLEYYFWFRSRMHFQARIGVVPLGGNTVFFKTAQLRAVGGWNQQCLTEDAEIGIRMSTKGAKIIATYDAEHVTKEETPPTVSQFIKQRTRWNQGFIQVLRLGEWRKYRGVTRKLFCFYTLSFPFAQTVLFLLTPLTLLIALKIKMPVAITLLSFLPILLVVIQVVINSAGLFEFTKEHNLKRKWHIFLLMIVSFIFYQLLLSIGAIRATYRELRGLNNWEKTVHVGQHRKSGAYVIAVPEEAKASI